MQTDVPRGTPAARKDQAALETPIHLGILPDPAFLAIVPSPLPSSSSLNGHYSRYCHALITELTPPTYTLTMVGAQTAPIRPPSTSSKVTASSSTPFFRFGSLSSLFGPSQTTTANVEGPPQGDVHRCELPCSTQNHAPYFHPTPFPQSSPPMAGPSVPAAVEQTPDNAILSHIVPASNIVPTHPSATASVCSNHPSPPSTRQQFLPGPYNRIDQSHVPLSPSGLPTNSGQGQDDRGVRVAVDTSIKSPAQLMMAEMESRRPWGVRLLEAHTGRCLPSGIRTLFPYAYGALDVHIMLTTDTTEAIQSLQQTCSAVADGQRSTRDKIFEVQNALKALPTKEDIWEELNEQRELTYRPCPLVSTAEVSAWTARDIPPAYS